MVTPFPVSTGIVCACRTWIHRHRCPQCSNPNADRNSSSPFHSNSRCTGSFPTVRQGSIICICSTRPTQPGCCSRLEKISLPPGVNRDVPGANTPSNFCSAAFCFWKCPYFAHTWTASSKAAAMLASSDERNMAFIPSSSALTILTRSHRISSTPWSRNLCSSPLMSLSAVMVHTVKSYCIIAESCTAHSVMPEKPTTANFSK